MRFMLASVCLAVVSSGWASAVERPDVLFIAIDDLNDWNQLYDSRAPTGVPNIDRLAQRGVFFSRAYCESPACNPWRTSLLIGRRASTTGVYGNHSDWRAAAPDAVTLPAWFKAHGYRTVGAGKIFHHQFASAFHDAAAFDDFQPMPDPPDSPMPPQKLNGLAWFGTANTDWGAWPADEHAAVDVQTVDYCIQRLAEPQDRPMFLAAGIFRPHMPFFAPQAYFDAIPKQRIVMPALLASDGDDLPSGARELLRETARFFEGIERADRAAPGAWSEAVRAYQACAAFADAQIGRLLDALESSGRKQRTIVVLWSDHGYHLGEKRHWEKFALWEKTTHVPLVIAAPGMAERGVRCARTVSLLDIYPTLVELCGLPQPPSLEGTSLVPLLEKHDAAWNRPAVMTYKRGNHAVRSERWRYIHYADGSEELYDHTNDPHEWHNLAEDGAYDAVLAEHRRWLPKHDAPPVRDLKPKR